jgi:hypothetical protein
VYCTKSLLVLNGFGATGDSAKAIEDVIFKTRLV